MIDELTVMQEPAETAIARGRALTADELFRMPDDGDRPRATSGSQRSPASVHRRPRPRYALVRGELQRMTPAGFDHGAVIMNLAVEGND